MACPSSIWLQRYSETSVSSLIEILDELYTVQSLRTAKLVVVKPNLCAGTVCPPTSAVVTNPEVLTLLIRVIRALNPKTKIAIVESDSIAMGLAPLKFAFQQYPERFREFSNLEFIDLSRTKIAVYPCTGRFFNRGVVLPTILQESDFFISLGKMKTHTNTVVTGILKNQLGCLPDGDKDKYHPYLPAVLADINTAIRPDLCIIEGCPAMEGPGPVNGFAKPMDLLIIGTDPLAVDATMTRIMGFTPEKIPMLRLAHEVGIGCLYSQDISVHGLELNKVESRFQFISREYQAYIAIGFAIQRVGQTVKQLGHLIHYIQGTKWALKKALRKIRKRLTL